MSTAAENPFGKSFLIGEILLGECIARHSRTPQHKRLPMALVRDEKIEKALEVYPELSRETISEDTIRNLTENQDSAARLRLYIMHYYDDPFDPHRIELSDDAYEECLRRHGDVLGLPRSTHERIQLAARRVNKEVLRKSSLSRIIAFGSLGLAGGVVLGLAAAPFLALAIGSYMGLSGSAAIGYGLAALGGGSLVSGGFGMTGGLFAAGATAGVAASSGATTFALVSLTREQFNQEVAQEAVLFDVLFIQERRDKSLACQQIEGIEARIAQVKDLLRHEERISDPGSGPITNLERIIDQLQRLLDWMRRHLDGLG